MSAPAFIITIDTEGDNLWARPPRVTTENVRFLPRFQALCERYGFKPTYLVNYEMALDPRFQAFGRAVLRRGAAEVGLHLHPWYSPPMEGGYDPRAPHVYPFELPDDLLHAKLAALTDLLVEVFEVRPVSHRAGKWGFDARVASALVALGFLVDCSVTPGLSWRRNMGAPNGKGGPDYSAFPRAPYFIDLADISRPGSSSLLEVPVTVMPNYPPRLEAAHRRVHRSVVGKAFRRVFGAPYTWLRPNGRNLAALLALADRAVEQRLPVLEFMLHSSELMRGGNPTFRSEEEIEVLYAHLTALFARLATLEVEGATLREFRRLWDGAA